MSDLMANYCKDCLAHSGMVNEITNIGRRVEGIHARLNDGAATLLVLKQQVLDQHEDVVAMTQTVKELCAEVEALKSDKQTGSSIRQFWGPIVVALIVLADKLFAHLGG